MAERRSTRRRSRSTVPSDRPGVVDAFDRGAEAELRRAQKMEAIGRLTTVLAHDFNNLLMGISGCADIALDKLAPGAEARPFIEDLRDAALRGATLTQQLLAFGRKGVIAPVVVDVNETVRRNETVLRGLLDETVELRITPAPGPACVRLDPGELEQILLNLAMNARHAMSRRGLLDIHVALADQTAEQARSHPGLAPGAYVMLTVSDTGQGMDEATRSRAFEPFFTTKEPGRGTGLGLGLATVYGIVTRGGGHIDLESELGQGTTVRILLPRVDELPRDVGHARRRSAPPGVAVLLVEDDPLVRRTLRYYLERGGHRVIEAADGREAAQAAAKHRGSIDLLLTDVALPGKDGPAVARELAAESPDLRVMYISAYSAADLLRDGRLPRGAHALRKPFDEDTLLREVRHALRRPPPDFGGASTILVVEDDEMSRRALCLFLEGRGHKVLQARGGADALKACAAHAGPIDLVLADLGLADCSGDQLVAQVRAVRPGVAALYISGRDRSDPTVKRALEGPRTAFLCKPFELDDLVKTIRDLLDEDPAPRA